MMIESLAPRLVLSTTPLASGIAAIDNHRRLIVITDDTDQQYSITQSTGRISVTDLDSGAQSTFANKKVRKIVVHLNDGDDYLKLDTHTSVLARGDYGDDMIIGGAENDDLFGDDGDDQLYGADGNDFISGGDGRDSIYGGNGDDRLHGDAGRDYINSFEKVQDASDTIDGGSGVDYLKMNSFDYVLNLGRDRPFNIDLPDMP